MTLRKWPGCSRIALALLAVTLSATLPPDAGAFGRGGRMVVPCNPPLFVPYYPPCEICEICEICNHTAYKVGNDDENFQVRIVGPDFGAIEIYLHSAAQGRDEFARDVLPGARDLHCHRSVLMAPLSPFGTFAVHYGHHRDTFKVYGWKKTATAPESNGPITLAAGHPVHLEWVTPRILKATAAHKELILRFNDSDKPWSVLYKNP